MPKRKGSRSIEENINHYKNKIKKLERKIRERDSKSASDSEDYPGLLDEDIGADTPALRPDDWLLEWPDDKTEEVSNDLSEPQPGPSNTTGGSEEPNIISDLTTELDNEILEILGDDPNCTNKYGPEIRNELANRLLHIIKEGLDKENRKKLISKYPLPINCVEIDAPKINLEIKAAIADTTIKQISGNV